MRAPRNPQATARPRRSGLAGFSLLFGAAFAMAVLFCAGSCTRKNSSGAKIARIVSLTPSTTETLFAIGAGGLVVGRSRYCDYPAAALALPVVGGYVDPNFEAVIALRPDLVVGARGPSGTRITDRLNAQGIATFFPPTESVSDVKAMILGMGERTGHVPEATRVRKALDERLAAVDHALEGRPRERVLLVFGIEPVVVAGPGSFPDEMLVRAGAENAVKDGTSYPALSIERVLALDPEVVLNAAVTESHGEQRITPNTPGWKELRAVKSGRVVALTDESVLRPGPRLADGVAVLARALHPSVSIP